MKSLYGVIGYPIEHSKSPMMHNAWFRNENFEGYYHPFKIEKNQLGNAIRGMKALQMKGWNVTIPYKEAIIPFLDEVDAAAVAIGAVNTVVYKNGKWVGTNTDGDGFVASLSLKRTKEQLKTSSILLIGAGGAAKGIYYALVNAGVNNIHIANRTVERASSLISKIAADGNFKGISLDSATEQLTQYDIIINTTSVGMYPEIDSVPIEVTNIKAGTLAVDIIYNPLETAFLKAAKERGAETLNGVGMFVYQGALAFEHWTGIRPDIEKAMTMIELNQGGTTC
ncbi:shikimate dehydrogenase [Jeotgalibacillus soli]|uniref:Shikimate dehydrogenase (NADP(+)) n=1 Tax=Jeotgalibacillus soli TaxID=889306 RepID=A0A0C2VKH4_9BACL|nr:shikimate dehydrogenase [Jeotgalibacillus soli]KIL44478.1 shikimate dehydrogenase [Jeotgalibacillus soli]